MKAIQIIENQASLAEAEMPKLRPNDILIKIKSTAVNRADLAQKNGLYPPPPGASEILGLECSGIVKSIGENVTSRKVGDEVCALLAGGGYAEYVACPEFQAIPKPKNLNWEEASALPEVYATCWLNLFLEGGLQSNNKILFHAGASGIGTAGIQLCKAFDCESFVSAGTQEKVDFCIALGASGGTVRGDNMFEEINNWSPNGVDIILDPVGANYFEDNLKCLALEGKLIIIGLMGGIESNINLGHLMMKRQKIIGSTIRARSEEHKKIIMQDLHKKVWPLFESGNLKPIIHKILPIDDAEKAHKIMEDNLNIGKLVLSFN
ncbi:MAG: NAD(P)H-quinone oxidoreductase [Gammaproteobacteria bacterium]|nr:NAD(P)H-quinone oxidoreductase [Gammaproteobacteria bacterium]HJL95365.1 NAD(P)H-quinone oxidoreductase [SAR86 cluster bacterium]|tara:strand:- start:3905 stop:4867 length:963 start_codon:yes stop_codon:yes gene_type:complete